MHSVLDTVTMTAAECMKLVCEKNELHEKLVDEVQEREALVKELDERALDHARVESQLAERDAEIECLKTKLTTSIQANRKQVTYIHAIHDRMDALAEQVKALEETRARKNKYLTEYIDENENLKTALETRTKERDAMERRCLDVEQKYTAFVAVYLTNGELVKQARSLLQSLQTTPRVQEAT